ncbi:hypothetical protein CASFOL_011346 [Castilleja foliolosa]|uniref:RNA helicase n=1 Tax=Castilleja foliolosa TaxID=1961234 RepID=A0ABD3DZB4_9LAMI
MARKGKKTAKKKKMNEVAQASEATRIRLVQILEQFQSSNDQVYKFEEYLHDKDASTVYELCKKMGMEPKTYGKGQNHCRLLAIYKNRKKTSEKEKESFIFSEESKAALQDLFSRYPPNDVEMTENKLRESSGKSNAVRAFKDDIFSKPKMSQSEIASKVKSLASSIKKLPSLRQITEKRTKLPISSFRNVITSTIETHQVMLICGETGCGKTTQVPQFLLDHSWGKGEVCKIVCTQPRRISATSVAERIASERGEDLGDSVGYKIRLESKGGRDSSLVFCTNGILLRVLVGRGNSRKNNKSTKKMKNKDFGITHIIVLAYETPSLCTFAFALCLGSRGPLRLDEIHERDRFSDIMLAIIRDMLPLYPHLRLVLMSATLDAERFSSYFGGCPVIRVPGFTYPVKSFYLEDVLPLVRSTINNKFASTTQDVIMADTSVTDECRAALDEAIDLALLNDDSDPLLELIVSEGTLEVFNYQHSKTGVTPLMVLATKGRVSAICMLLSLGVDCSLKSKEGKTAFDYAKQGRQREAAEIIRIRMPIKSTKSEDQRSLDIRKSMPNKSTNSEDQRSLDIRKSMPNKSTNSEDQRLLDEYLLKVNPELIDFVLIEQLLRRICNDSKDGAILVFLPGWDEIHRSREKLLASPFFKDPSRYIILALHSRVPSMEQKEVFKRPPPGCRKIILTTNIAETSVTIDDVVYVVDSGRMKEKNYDPYDNISTLQSSWISKANAKQRQGRAGRCQPGICYHLFSKDRAASLLDFQVPEIKRMPIEELCLQLKLIDPSCKIEDFMKKTLDPPVEKTIHNAIAVLQDVGALTHDEKLTELGEKLGALPVHPLTSRMLFLAILLNCLDPALTLAVASDYRSPFISSTSPKEKEKAQAAKRELASFYGGNGDQLAVIAAFDCWRMAKDRGEQNKFCSQYFVSPNIMRMLSHMRKQLEGELHRFGFIPENASCCSLNGRNPGILQAVLVAGMYPMVGRMIPVGRYNLVETMDGNKVRLHRFSTNSKLSVNKFEVPPLITFDEIIRGDGGMLIRDCSLIGSFPLLLLASEIEVAQASDNYVEDENNNDREDDNNECKMENESLSSSNQGEKIMSSPNNVVKVIVDKWLTLESTALDVAQIYCLRERIAAAILFKVKYPREALPEHLGASLYAIACLLSYDGMTGISLPTKPVPVDSFGTYIGQAYDEKAMVIDRNPESYLTSLLLDCQNDALEPQNPVPEIPKKRLSGCKRRALRALCKVI